MDLANGGDAPNGDVVDSDKMRRRRKKVEMAQEAVHGFPERQGGSMANRRQREVDEGLVSSLLPKRCAFLAGWIALACTRDGSDRRIFGLNCSSLICSDAEQNSFLPNHLPAEKGQKNSEEVELTDIAKDLNKIKRQNTITHVLLGAVIVMTAVWQVNEMSFLLWVQKKLSNPFNSLGDLIKGSLKLKGRKPAVIESSPLPPVGIPDVTRADLPTFVISGEHR